MADTPQQTRERLQCMRVFAQRIAGDPDSGEAAELLAGDLLFLLDHGAEVIADLRTRLREAEAREERYRDALRAIAGSIYRGPHPTALREIARAALETPKEGT